ncbi:hypothetical protein SNEBB_010422 [Seison nebaliae]|nr:hypothetical protein SNEBB_010422 [Seison nebaliae]
MTKRSISCVTGSDNDASVRPSKIPRSSNDLASNEYEVRRIEKLRGIHNTPNEKFTVYWRRYDDSYKTVLPRSALTGCVMLLEQHDSVIENRLPIVPAGGVAMVYGPSALSLIDEQRQQFSNAIDKQVVSDTIIRYKHGKIRGKKQVTDGRLGKSTTISRILHLLKKDGPAVFLEHELCQYSYGAGPGCYHSVLFYRLEDIIVLYDNTLICKADLSIVVKNNGLVRDALRFLRRNCSRSTRFYCVCYESSVSQNPNCLLAGIQHMNYVKQYMSYYRSVTIVDLPFTLLEVPLSLI